MMVFSTEGSTTSVVYSKVFCVPLSSSVQYVNCPVIVYISNSSPVVYNGLSSSQPLSHSRSSSIVVVLPGVTRFVF